jgi:hypothetical protein
VGAVGRAGVAPAETVERDGGAAAEAEVDEGLTEAERAARMHVLDEPDRHRKLTDFFTTDGAVLGKGECARGPPFRWRTQLT